MGNAAHEWRQHWGLVLASTFGMSMSVLALNALGLFIEPLQAAFGWSRSTITSGLTIYALIAVPLAPVIGAAVDRWGSRRLAVPGLALTGLGFAAFAFASDSVLVWWALWLLYSLVAVSVKPPVWMAAVSGAFAAGRGLALALTLCGSAMTSVMAPLILNWAITALGWRTAFVAVGIGWASAALCVVLPFFVESGRGATKSGAVSAAPRRTAAWVQGLTLREALRNPPFLRIVAASFGATLLLAAVVVHMVPILTGGGFTRQGAAGVASLFGLASIGGKLGSGWLLDHTRCAPLPSICLGLPALACCLLLGAGASVVVAGFAVVVFGLAAGAQLQLSAYLTTRYVGLANYGKLYGVVMSLAALATGLGPLIAGLGYDLYGDYRPLLVGGIGIGVVGALLMWRLGEYPDWAAPRPDAPSRVAL
jgi:MFS family permease